MKQVWGGMAVLCVAVLAGCQGAAGARPLPDGADKRSLPTLDAGLRQAVDSGRDPATLPQARLWRFDTQGRVRVEVRFLTPLDNAGEARLRAMGFDTDRISPDGLHAEGWAAWSALSDVAREPAVRQVSPSRRATPQ